MTDLDMRASIRAAGLRQIDFVRLVAHLTGQPMEGSNPSKALVSSWCAGRHAAPHTAYAVLRLFEMLDNVDRGRLLVAIGGTPPT